MTAQTIYSTLETWRPRSYYIFENITTGKLYVGQHVNPMDETSYLGSGPDWVEHCHENGGYNKENIHLRSWEWFENEDDAKEWLDLFEETNPGYYLNENKTWANQVPETTASNVFQDPKSNPNNITECKEKSSKKQSQTKSDPEWKATIGKISIIKQIETKSDPDWKETVGKEASQKISQTKSDPDWKETVGKEAKRKELETKSDPKWKEQVLKPVLEKTCMVKKNPVHDIIKNGKHFFSNVGSDYFKNNALERVKDGSNPFLKVFCLDKNGKRVDLSKEEYSKQKIGPQSDWEFVHINTKEAKRRKK